MQKHLNTAIKEIDAAEKAGQPDSTAEHSVMKKLLKIDRKFATLMAFDMFFAGIDTVNNTFKIRKF